MCNDSISLWRQQDFWILFSSFVLNSYLFEWKFNSALPELPEVRLRLVIADFEIAA